MTIISCPGYGAARRQETTTSCCTRTVTCPCIMPEILCVSRTRSHECSERLEPDIGELIRPVLRGGGGGNAVSLLDAMRMTVLGQYLKGLLRLNQAGGRVIQKKLESVKWSLWHGQVDKALERLE